MTQKLDFLGSKIFFSIFEFLTKKSIFRPPLLLGFVFLATGTSPKLSEINRKTQKGQYTDTPAIHGGGVI